jgi:hypothetical protein
VSMYASALMVVRQCCVMLTFSSPLTLLLCLHV